MKALARTLTLCGALSGTALVAQRVHGPEPFQFGISETIRSQVLGEDRVLNIYLPHGYSADTVAAYPVIFLLDGSADEDFIHVSGAVQFASYPWIQWMPQSVVVGIANVDRKRDFTFPTSIAKDKEQFPTTGGSAAFLRFLGDELIPFVEGNYRIGADRMLIGQSLGGLFATEVLFKRPELFTRYLIVSPSLWWDGGSLLEQEPAFVGHADHIPKTVFIAVGKEGKNMVRPAQALTRKVRKEKGIRVGYRYLPLFDHANILHRAVMDGFRWLSEPETK
jgi:predicted alpha/beta superfamily hydrolase